MNFKNVIEKFSGNYNEVCLFLYDLLVFPGEKLEKYHPIYQGNIWKISLDRSNHLLA
jgi:hypothetical protein